MPPESGNGHGGIDIESGLFRILELNIAYVEHLA